jgi:hypothetical protein
VKYILWLILILHASVASAQHAMSGPDFEAFVEGRSLHFEQAGRHFGSEQFFSGRRSLWRYPDGTCTPGRWREKTGLICFTYEDIPGDQCWQVRNNAGRLVAESYADARPTGLVVEMTQADTHPLPCPGPETGT